MKFLSKKRWLIMGVATLLGAGISYAALNDSVNVSITIPGTLTISDDGVPLSIANLTPGTVDSSGVNTITVSSNSSSGFTVGMELEDTEGVKGQLCENDGEDQCTSNVFDGDGTASYISFTSEKGVGSLDLLSGVAFTVTETKLGPLSYPAFSTTDVTNADAFNVHYDVYADNTVVPTTYEGDITVTIVAN